MSKPKIPRNVKLMILPSGTYDIMAYWKHDFKILATFACLGDAIAAFPSYKHACHIKQNKPKPSTQSP